MEQRSQIDTNGVGDDANTTLLDTLAQRHRGATTYVRPHERIDETTTAFYAKVSAPLLTNIELEFGSVMVDDVFPSPLPDLFSGSQLIVTGKYRLASTEAKPVSITLTGEVNGIEQAFIYEATFRSRGGDDHIPRLWATRKIGHLLTQIRLHGEQREWIDAIVALSLRYGVIRPYTSFLINEVNVLTQTECSQAAEKMAYGPASSGASAVAASTAEVFMRNAVSAVGSRPYSEDMHRRVIVVGNRTFVLRERAWWDTHFDPERMRTVKVAFASDAYFRPLAARPSWGAYLTRLAIE